MHAMHILQSMLAILQSMLMMLLDTGSSQKGSKQVLVLSFKEGSQAFMADQEKDLAKWA